jgi:hypothetical protein
VRTLVMSRGLLGAAALHFYRRKTARSLKA